MNGQVVNVQWLQHVRGLCESMGLQLLANVIRVAGPDGDDPDSDCSDLVSVGDLMLFVWIRVDKRICISVGMLMPASDLVAVPVHW
jgi:hypothetical protein